MCKLIHLIALLALTLSPVQSIAGFNYLKDVSLWFGDKLLDAYGLTSPLVGHDCQSWFESDTGPPDDLPSCPPTAQLARQDTNFMVDPSCPSAPCMFHPGAEFCVRSKLATASGGGQQCCYLGDDLLVGPPGGGTADKCHSSRALCYFREDVLPWVLCCKDQPMRRCLLYYEKRPSDIGHKYQVT